MRLILLTGERGVGKRSIAEVLVATQNFVHENVDEAGRSLNDLLLDAHARGSDAIVIWSERPSAQAVALARHLGFEWIEPRLIPARDEKGSSRALASILSELGRR
jgi:predicted ATPase